MEAKSAFNQLKERERLERKQVIIEAALKLFSSKGFSDIGMRDIAKEAGISPALIYRYFKNRDDLFVEVSISEVEKFSDKLVREGCTDIKELSKRYIQFLLHESFYFDMMTHFSLNGSLEDEPLEKFNDAMRGFLKIFERSLVATGLSKNTKSYSSVLYSALNGIVITYINYPGRSKEETEKHMEDLTELLVALFVKLKDTND